jgi:hypothetical protein
MDYGAVMLYDGMAMIDDFSYGDNYPALDNVFIWVWAQFAELGVAMQWVDDLTGLGTTAAQQVTIGSSFLNDTLNATGHVNTEIANATTSVAVRVTAEDYTYGGPLRLVSSANDAYLWHLFINGLGASLLGLAAEIMSDNYPLSAQNEIEIYDLSLMATLLFDLEPVWCAGVSQPHYSLPWTFTTCNDNDGFVPLDRQARPGTGVSTVEWLDAKAHLSEVEESTRIIDLLNIRFGVSY